MKPVRVETISNDKLKLKADIHFVNGFSKKERLFYLRAIETAIYVVNTIEFRNEVLSTPMTWKGDYSNKQIYDMFMKGVDKFDDTPDYDIDIKVTAFYKNSRTIGYTYPTTARTWINRKFFRMTDSGMRTIGGNLIHEQMHNLNFKHKSRGYTRREVPYKYGSIASALIKRVQKGEKFTLLS